MKPGASSGEESWGQSTVTAYVRLNYDPNVAMTDVMAKVQQVKYQIPEEANDPVFAEKLAKVEGYADTFQKTIPNTGIKFTPQPYFIQSTTEWAATLQQIVLSGANPETAMKELAKRISRETSKLKLAGEKTN